MRIGCRLELFIRPVALYMYPCIGIEICISLCYNHLKGYKACRGSKGERMAHTIREPEKQLNVSAECDVLVCGGVVLVQSLLNMLWGDQHDFNTEFIAAFIGLIAAFFLDLPLLHTVALALCIRLVVISAVSGVLLLRARGKE